MRFRRVVIGAACIVVAAAVTTVALRSRDVGEAADTSDPKAPKASLATAEQRDLTRSETFDGRVGHGTETPLKLTGNGVITHLPAVGDVIRFGHELAEVDGEPVLLLEGERPAWRELGPDTGRDEDVRQLEAVLVAMGFADPAKVVVDNTWTPSTTAAVKAMQALNGMPIDGRLSLGEFVFSPEVIRIADVGGHLGDDAGAAGLQTTGLDQSVLATVKSSKIDLIELGARVTLEMPTGETIDGTIAKIEAAVVADDGSVTFPVDITTGALGVDDGTTVEVDVDVVSAADAIAVPAEALLALAEGGYAVEVPDRQVSMRDGLIIDDSRSRAA